MATVIMRHGNDRSLWRRTSLRWAVPAVVSLFLCTACEGPSARTAGGWTRKILPGPNAGNQQTASVVLDVDGDNVDDFVVAERTKTPSVVWYKYNGSTWLRSRGAKRIATIWRTSTATGIWISSRSAGATRSSGCTSTSRPLMMRSPLSQAPTHHQNPAEVRAPAFGPWWVREAIWKPQSMGYATFYISLIAQRNRAFRPLSRV